MKTVQQNAGHYSAAFTLDRYAHVTETMHRESAARMQNFFEGLKKDEQTAEKIPARAAKSPPGYRPENRRKFQWGVWWGYKEPKKG